MFSLNFKTNEHNSINGATYNKPLFQRTVILTALVIIAGLGLLIGGAICSSSTSAHIASYMNTQPDVNQWGDWQLGYIDQTMDGTVIFTSYGWMSLAQYTQVMGNLNAMLTTFQVLKISGIILLSGVIVIAPTLFLMRHYGMHH